MTLIEQLQRAATLYQQRQFAEAQTLIQQTLREHSNAPDVWRFAGVIGRASGDPQAESCLRHALRLQPGNTETLNTLAGLLHDQQREREAEACYREALQADPGNGAVLNNLCRQMLSQGRASDVLALTANLDSNARPALWRQRGEALLLSGRPDLALPAFDHSLQLAPQAPLGVHGCVRALLELGRFAEAREIAEARASDRSFAVLLVKALAGQNEWQMAVELATRLATAHPDLPETVFVAAQMLWMQGRGDTVSGLLAEVGTCHAGMTSDVMCAVILRGMGDYQRALSTLAMAEQRYGKHPHIDCARTDVALELGDTALALEAAEAAFAIAPETLANRTALAQALLVNGQAARALPLIEETLQTLPDHQHWLALWGDALRMLGDARHEWLLDYETMAKPFRLAPPSGYDSIETFNTDLARSLEQLHQMRVHPLDQSLKLGSQTHIDLRFIGDPVIQAFIGIIQGAIEQYVDALPQDNNHPLYRRRSKQARPSGMWSVRLEPEGRHVNHVHPQGWLSSAYYVAVPPPDPEAADAGALQLGLPRYPTPGATAARIIPAVAGNLVLFPSYMWHGTVPARTGTRLTIAFDVTPQRDLL